MRITLYCILFLSCVLIGCTSVPPESSTPAPVSRELPSTAGKVPEETPSPVSPPVTSPVETTPKTGGIVLSFLDSEGGKPLSVNYRLYPSDSPESPVAEDSGSSVTLTLKPGNYSLLASWETGTRNFDGISVTADRLSEKTIVMNAGTLALRFLDVPGGKSEEAEYTLYGQDSHAVPVAVGSCTDPSLLLPEGLYDLCIRKETDSAFSYGLPVTAGEITEHTVVLSKATLAINFIDPSTGAPAWAEYRVYPAGTWEEILLWEDGDGFTVYLDPGTYDIYYAWDDGEGWMNGISLSAGSVLKTDISLQ